MGFAFFHTFLCLWCIYELYDTPLCTRKNTSLVLRTHEVWIHIFTCAEWCIYYLFLFGLFLLPKVEIGQHIHFRIKFVHETKRIMVF